MEQEVEVSYLPYAKFINITEWERKYYTDIPQQKDKIQNAIHTTAISPTHYVLHIYNEKQQLMWHLCAQIYVGVEWG
jgi:hypothetical protein